LEGKMIGKPAKQKKRLILSDLAKKESTWHSKKRAKDKKQVQKLMRARSHIPHSHPTI